MFRRRRQQGGRFAVVDVETTGLYNSDRIVEVAVVTITGDGRVVDEWDTLINPQRDVGPTHIHRITPSMVSAAPTFEEIAVALARRLDGAVLVAHNLPFDVRMLTNEFRRVGGRLDPGDGFCTYRATGENLAAACRRRSIPLENAHRALVDVRATARLLTAIADPGTLSRATPAAVEPPRVAFNPRTLRRDAHAVGEPPMPYQVERDGGVVAHREADPTLRYLDLLDAVMSDGVLTPDERHRLTRLAAGAGFSPHTVRQIHVRYLDDIIDAALRDGVIDDAERALIGRTASELDVDPGHVGERIDGHAVGHGSTNLAPGTRVCFTGTGIAPDGSVLSRDDLTGIAARRGLHPVANVTKKGCDLLVASDPSSQSGKAKKARAYGIPIAAVADFLASGPGEAVRTVG